MKCLSLWQPWASLIVGGEKRVETRGWATQYRGPLLIHAAKRWTATEGMIAAGPVFRAALKRLGFGMEADESKARKGWGMPFGAIVGRVYVLTCYATEDVTDDVNPLSDGTPVEAADGLRITHKEREFGDYSFGRYGFLLTNPVRFPTPIPLAGKQGLFDVTGKAADLADEQVALALGSVAPADYDRGKLPQAHPSEAPAEFLA